MRTVLGHRSWNEQEILAFFDKGSFTMCSLPHYRYDRVKSVCGMLRRCGFIREVGRTDTGVNFVATPAYHQWRQDVAEGKAPASLAKLYKLQHPPKLVKRTCRHCPREFETFDPHQKLCSKECKIAERREKRAVA